MARSRITRDGDAFDARRSAMRSSSMVMANHRSLDIPWRAAAVEPINALVYGLPTTSTRQAGLGVAGDRLALSGKDAAVHAEQVLALHPRGAGRRRRERPVGIGECLIGVGRAGDRASSGKAQSSSPCARRRASPGPREAPGAEGGPASARASARRDAEEQRVSDLSCGAGDGNAHGSRASFSCRGRVRTSVAQPQASSETGHPCPDAQSDTAAAIDGNAIRGSQSAIAERDTHACSLDSASSRIGASGRPRRGTRR